MICLERVCPDLVFPCESSSEFVTEPLLSPYILSVPSLSLLLWNVPIFLNYLITLLNDADMHLLLIIENIESFARHFYLHLQYINLVTKNNWFYLQYISRISLPTLSAASALVIKDFITSYLNIRKKIPWKKKKPIYSICPFFTVWIQPLLQLFLPYHLFECHIPKCTEGDAILYVLKVNICCLGLEPPFMPGKFSLMLTILIKSTFC